MPRKSIASLHTFTACIAILGSLLAWATIYAMLTATGGELHAMFDPKTALSLAPEAQQWFRVAMLTDAFGYYLPFFVVGGYLWSGLREEGGAAVDMAVLFLLLYVVLGVIGAAIQYAALPPLALAHEGGDLAVKAATEQAWAAVVFACQQGLWWMEGPLLPFWAFVMGPLLRRRGWGHGLLLMLCGALYALAFVGSLVGADAYLEPIQTLAIVLLPLWTLLIGIDLLRSRGVLSTIGETPCADH